MFMKNPQNQYFQQFQQACSSEWSSKACWNRIIYETSHIQFKCNKGTHLIMTGFNVLTCNRRLTSWTRALWGFLWTRRPQTGPEHGSGQERSGQSAGKLCVNISWGEFIIRTESVMVRPRSNATGENPFERIQVQPSSIVLLNQWDLQLSGCWHRGCCCKSL